MKKFLIYAAKILFLLLAIFVVFVSVLGVENYAKLIFLLMMGFFIAVLCFERVTWEQKNVSMMKKMKADLSFLSQLFYILTFFYKYVFFPLLNKINYV